LCNSNNNYSFRNSSLKVNKDCDLEGGVSDEDGNAIMASAWGVGKYFDVSYLYIVFINVYYII
jgi:hypothetical protein